MEVSELMNILQATLGSVVMISSSALICLIIQTRYGRVVDRIRHLLAERRNLQQDVAKEQATAADTDFIMGRLRNIDAQIELLLRRGLKLKRALFLTFSAVFSFIFTSFLTLIGTAIGTAIIIPLVALTFFLGMFFLLIGAVTTVNEIANSYDAISREVKFARSEISRSYPERIVEPTA
ncbi:DUF2721 domain-containing protein [Candidatus Bathyarchaeota archaeon]|nr:DUF2721 domain-containing protein [Candidatus Bathyarchaeota archaeon]